MVEKYFTVDEISEMLGMHPKTIQKYIREGRLKANKVGKYWRVTGHDLSRFVEGPDAYVKKSREIEMGEATEKTIRVSSVVDIEVEDMDEGMRIVNTLTAAMNARIQDSGNNTLKAQYFESDFRIQIMLWGDLKFMSYMLGSIEVLTADES